MDSSEKKILVFDKYLGHGKYAQDYFKGNNYDFIVSDKFKVNNPNEFERVIGVILFVYDDYDCLLYTLLAKMEKLTNLVLCVEAKNLEWFRTYYPHLSVLDASTPKFELFSQLKEQLNLNMNTTGVKKTTSP